MRSFIGRNPLQLGEPVMLVEDGKPGHHASKRNMENLDYAFSYSTKIRTSELVFNLVDGLMIYRKEKERESDDFV